MAALLLAALVALMAFAAVAATAEAQVRPADQLLSDRPLAPTDRTTFDTYAYPETSAMVPAAGSEPSEEQAARMLDTYLAAEYPGDVSAQNAAKAVFTDPAAASKIPSPSLRAAFAALRGTIADAAIGFVLTARTPGGEPKVIDATFAPPSRFSCSCAIAEVKTVSTGQLHIIFNDRFRAEDPFLFTFAWAHEPLHQDSQVTGAEEGVNGSLEALVYLRQLARHPAMASEGTELARTINTKAAIRLNSGLGSRLGLYAANGGRDVLPGSSHHLKSWADAFLGADQTATPGNALLGAYLAGAHAAGAPSCSSGSFDKTLLDCIDANGNGGLTSEELVAAVRALKLDLDSDGDGVFDSRDACPTLAATTADGCPALAPGRGPGAGPRGGAPSRARIAAVVSGDLKAAAAALRRAGIRKLFRHRGFTLGALHGLETGRFSLALTRGATRGRRSHAATTEVEIAAGSRSVSAGGRSSLTVGLTGRGRRLLQRARRFTGTLTLTFTARSGQAGKRSVRVALKR